VLGTADCALESGVAAFAVVSPVVEVVARCVSAAEGTLAVAGTFRSFR
jgi:hypothetical protein